MVSVSPKCLDVIKGDSLVVDWSGTITLTDNTVYDFTHRNIDNGSGEINLSCSSMSAVILLIVALNVLYSFSHLLVIDT